MMAEPNLGSSHPLGLSRPIGWLLVALGGGWLTYLAAALAQIVMGWVSSSDISLAFWSPVALVTGPVALVLAVVGGSLVLAAGWRRRAEQAAAPDPAGVKRYCG
jgi:hypothetical protein